ncbi:hypothetical protein M0R45_011516 [Rubus argutus]|uniref:Uncharacterized protein n=1 Tax=Rubus argutus TaxID=59490 RepID=A0AAW1YEB0_RUBAR
MAENGEAPNDIESQQGQHMPLITSMRQELEELPTFSSLCCIYKVPERLRRVSEKAYTPQVVSIGPLHHSKVGLKAMEVHKKRYLQDFISRSKGSLEEYVVNMKNQEAKLRNCYAETIQFGSDEFVKIILVDAAFIIEVLLRYHFHELQEENDRIFNKPWMLQDVWPDMRLLENQLPFFVLEELYAKVSSNLPVTPVTPSLIDLSYHFFTSLMHIEGTEGNLENIRSSTVEHFVDFCRSLYLPLPLKRPIKGRLETLTTPSMTDLHRAGVKFKDVELLVKYGIVENRLGDSSGGSTLINNLADGVIFDSKDFCYAALCKDLNNYCSWTWHKWKANLRQNYFNTPWAVISFTAAVILLILTLVQAVCSVISATQQSQQSQH